MKKLRSGVYLAGGGVSLIVALTALKKDNQKSIHHIHKQNFTNLLYKKNHKQTNLNMEIYHF